MKEPNVSEWLRKKFIRQSYEERMKAIGEGWVGSCYSVSWIARHFGKSFSIGYVAANAQNRPWTVYIHLDNTILAYFDDHLTAKEFVAWVLARHDREFKKKCKDTHNAVQQAIKASKRRVK